MRRGLLMNSNEKVYIHLCIWGTLNNFVVWKIDCSSCLSALVNICEAKLHHLAFIPPIVVFVPLMWLAPSLPDTIYSNILGSFIQPVRLFHTGIPLHVCQYYLNFMTHIPVISHCCTDLRQKKHQIKQSGSQLVINS